MVRTSANESKVFFCALYIDPRIVHCVSGMTSRKAKRQFKVITIVE